jgi:hypothetical protein
MRAFLVAMVAMAAIAVGANAALQRLDLPREAEPSVRLD